MSEDIKKEYWVKNALIDEANENLAPKNIVKEVSESFLEYAMSVIVSRALPDARDGLKPVHRRILYSMHNSGFDHSKPFKKCARIVGDVLGKYHPHGDTAIYDSLVRMSQDFSMRHPLIQGHGNFGSVDGDSAAAMRYTEARMAKISSLMTTDLNKNVVEFIDNYDASETEPTILPSRFPNLLVNGSVGIAVGMATNIPPHNLQEIIDATILLAENPEITIDEIHQVVKGPDFPTGGIIMGNIGIINALETGRGSITVRSKGTIKELNGGRSRLIYTEIPYLQNKAKLIEKIAHLVRDKKIIGITGLRDESNRNGIRIVIDIKRHANPKVIENKLFKLSPLQTSYGINTLALVEGKPEVLNIKQVLSIFLKFQVNIVTKRTKFELEKTKAKILILQGLKIAIENIDKTIEIIKKSASDNDAIEILKKEFNLLEVQAKAIVNMRLGRLTGLAQEKMENEIILLAKKIEEYEEILNNPNVLIGKITEDLSYIRDNFSNPRRTKIIDGDVKKISEEDLISKKDIIITLSKQGYVKRLLLEEYKIQKRGGVGSKAGTLYEDDKVEKLIVTNTHTDLLIFTSFGKVYRIRSHQIPPASKQSKGTPFINIINILKTEKVIAIRTADNYNDENKFLLTITVNGVVKKTKLSEYSRINKSGKKALSLREKDMLFDAIIIEKNNEILIGSRFGKVVRFSEDQLRPLGRTASGVKGINLNATGRGTNRVIGLIKSSSEDQNILSISEKGFGKMTTVSKYRKTKRGAKGVSSINTKKAGNLISIKNVKGDEEAIIMTKQSVCIRVNLSTVSHSSRLTKGVKIIRLKEGNRITSLGIFELKKLDKQIEEAIEKTNEIDIKEFVTQEMKLDAIKTEIKKQGKK